MWPRAPYTAGAALLWIGCAAAPAVPPPSSTKAGPAEPHAVESAPSDPRYDLRLSIDIDTKTLSASGEVTSYPPRTRFFLNEALAIDELVVRDQPVPYTRTKSRIDLPQPVSTFRIRYHGRLERSGGTRDFKSAAWLDADEVRLTEITAFYPLFFDGSGAVPWPPVPGVGMLTVKRALGLNWVASSQEREGETFAFTRPSDFVLVGVPFDGSILTLDPPNEAFALTVYSPRATALRPMLVEAMGEHLTRFGPLGERAMNIVEFPATGTENGLAFLTSNLIVLSSKTCDYVAQSTPRALRVVSHEFAHRWFGGVLRARGPAIRWLVESFAEYYAWRVVRTKHGDAPLADVLREVRKDAGPVPVRIPDLGWEDERVYTAGSLGVLALADAVGETVLDQAIRSIVRAKSEWSAGALFEAIREAHGDPGKLERFSSDWGF